MHQMYGTSLRNLFVFANAPELYGQLVNEAIQELSADRLSHVLLCADTASDDCHYLMSTGPSSTNRAQPEVTFSSPYIFGECRRRILKDDVEKLRSLANRLHSEQSTTAFVGMIFGHQAHQLLQEGLSTSSLSLPTKKPNALTIQISERRRVPSVTKQPQPTANDQPWRSPLPPGIPDHDERKTRSRRERP